MKNLTEEELYELLKIYESAYKEALSVCGDIVCNAHILPIRMLATVNQAKKVRDEYGGHIWYRFRQCKDEGKPFSPMRTIN